MLAGVEVGENRFQMLEDRPRDPKARWGGGETVPPAGGAGKTGPHTQNELDPCLTPDTKISSKWMKGLQARPEHTGETASCHWSGQWCLGYDTEGTGDRNKNK